MTTALRPRIVADRLPIPPAEALEIVVRELGGRLGFPDKRYDLRIEVRSDSRVGVNHRLTHDRKDGRFGCSCEDWIYGDRELGDIRCRHLKRWAPYLTQVLELQAVAAIPPPAGVWW